MIDPASQFHYHWLIVISLAVCYNIIFIIGRGIFWGLHNLCPSTWCLLDYLCDLIYLVDMLANSRTGYLEQGILVRNSSKLTRHYIASYAFKLDIISLLPTDFAYLLMPPRCTPNRVPCAIIVRLNRLLRFHRLAQFFDRTESITNFPFIFRIGKLVFYILVIIHWNACLYFAISYAIGFGSDQWVYQPQSSPPQVQNNHQHHLHPREESSSLSFLRIDGLTKASEINDSLVHQYIYCFYWSTLTLTTIGEVPMPERDEEYLFVVIDFLIGLLIFATIVGNIGSMITNMNAARADFQHKMDSVKQWMKFRKVNKELEDRIIKWFDYLWANRQTLDEDAVTAILPDRLKAETAIHVHLETLKRVQLFQDCEPGLLVQLVLKLKLQVFSPGDYICRVGDVGKEMYIVKRGELSVLAEDCKTVYGKLTDGSVFGELSILNISGVKTDLWSVLEDYPDAKTLLVQRGKGILRKDGLLLDDAISQNSSSTFTTACPSTSQANLQVARTPSLYGLVGDSSDLQDTPTREIVSRKLPISLPKTNSNHSFRSKIINQTLSTALLPVTESQSLEKKDPPSSTSPIVRRKPQIKKSLSFAVDTHLNSKIYPESYRTKTSSGFENEQQAKNPYIISRMFTSNQRPPFLYQPNLSISDNSLPINLDLQSQHSLACGAYFTSNCKPNLDAGGNIHSTHDGQTVVVDMLNMLMKVDELCKETKQAQDGAQACLKRLENILILKETDR